MIANESQGAELLNQDSTEYPNFSQAPNGLLPAVARDNATGEVLMLAWMNQQSFAATLQSGYAVYYSRSRQELWKKGNTSGNLQKVVAIHTDCDADAILLTVEQTGAACHKGYRSCFFRKRTDQGWIVEGQKVQSD